MREQPKATNIVWHHGDISRETRESILNQTGCILWFTGLSGSGKSTVARTVEHALVSLGHLAYVLDGDNLRHGLNGDLGFAPEERKENIRRVAEVAALFGDAGLITLTAFISPYRIDRDRARSVAEASGVAFMEVFVDTPVEVCEARDPKGLYRKARAGELENFTGISAPYEPPESPEFRVATADRSATDCAQELVAMLTERGLIRTHT